MVLRRLLWRALSIMVVLLVPATSPAQGPFRIKQNQSPFPIDDDRRSLARREEIDRPKILKVLRPCRRYRERQRENQCSGDAEPAALPVHFAITSIVLKALRPKRSGRYMS